MIAAALKCIFSEECVYSIVARYSDFGPHASLRAISTEILGFESQSVAVDLPRHLSHLASSLLKDLNVSAEKLLLDHTLFPLYAPFITASQRAKTMAAMMGDGHPHFACGMAASAIKTARYLRLCPECMRFSVSTTGYCVWRRAHQAPGVHWCCEHDCALHTTDVEPYNLNAAPSLVAARLATVQEEQPAHSDDRSRLAEIASDVAWLLGNRQCPGPENLHAVYHARLRDHGYVRADGSIRVGKLSRNLNDHFGTELLAWLGTPVVLNQRDNWVERLSRRHQNAQAPLRHILFIRFLGLDAAQVLRLAQAAIPLPPRKPSKPHRHQIRILSTSLRDARRNAWLAALENQAREPLRTSHDNLYSWLWRNDHDWLLAHRPSRVGRSRRRIDWPKWDTALTKQVTEIAARLRAQTDPFTRVTKNRIVSSTGKPAWFSKPNPNLPSASHAIEQVTETAEHFAIRRLAFLAGKMGMRRSPAWKLRVAAGIGAPLARRPAVQSFLMTVACPPASTSSTP